MASDSPGGYKMMNDSQDCHVLSSLIADGSCGPRGQYQIGGFQKDASYGMKDSGYYVNTSDGASTCSSSTTEPGENEGGTLLVLEPKSLRSFTTNDEYLYAMKEDLADWFACLYQRDDLTAENFLQVLETGVLLCRHANKVQEFASQRREMGESLEMRSYFIRSVPVGNVSFREGVKPETFQARDNVSNFISWGRQLGIPEVLSFETDDLVLRKNEKSVILCLLEIARIGAKLGMLAPTLIQMEQEIDAELAGEEPKPHVQIITCDMRSLDERVRDLIGRCTCPVQFPMIKVGEGKYKIGDSRSLIFVRILRNHVMVRVGGGWDTLENYLNKHDPCQCNYRGHRPTTGAAHKVVVSQQRQPTPQGAPVSKTTPNTPTSPRRGSTTTPAKHSSNSTISTTSKTPVLVISRHLPATARRGSSPENHLKPGVQSPASQSQQAGPPETTPHLSSNLPTYTLSHPSPNSAHHRSPSPRTKIPGLPQTTNSAQLKERDMRARRCLIGTLDNSEDSEVANNDGYIAEDEDSQSHNLREKLRSEPCDGNVSLHSMEEGHDSGVTSLDTSGTTGVSMEKISTMTLAEFKSLLSSSLSVPEEQQQQSQVESRMHKSFPTTKTTKGATLDNDKPGQKEEYQMARPKPISQIKRDAVAKVAGAISTWVESRTEADAGSQFCNKTKTPTRPQTLLGPQNNNSSQNATDDNLDNSGATTTTNSMMQSLIFAPHERPVTPSRIPKPSFIPRPKTPVSFSADSPSDPTFPLHHGIHSNMTRTSIIQNSRPVNLSRSNSNSSSAKSVDEAPVSPSNSLNEDRIFKINSRSRRLSNVSDSFSTNSNNTNNSNAGRSYKDIYTAKRAATSGSEGRIPSTRAVTPGPREKWTLCGGGSNSCSSSFSENAIATPNSQRRRSINTTCQTDKQNTQKHINMQSMHSSSIDNEQAMSITNEITFSDDEEINELVKTAALKAKHYSDNRKLHSMKENDDTLVINRALSLKGNSNSDSKFSVVRRPASRGSSVDRASLATVMSKLYQASQSSMTGQKSMAVGKSNEQYGTPSSVDNGQNRTEAWVDSTLSDNKKRPSSRTKQAKAGGNDIQASDLTSRPLEEIQAILSEPKNGFVHVDVRTLEAPAEDPEMFRKMEKLFEKYREMELKSSSKEASGGSRPIKKHSDSQSAKDVTREPSHRTSKQSVSGTSGKISNVSFISSTDQLPWHLHMAPSSGKISFNEDIKRPRSSNSTRPFRSQHYSSSNNSPTFTLPSYETQDYFNSDIVNQNEPLSEIIKNSKPRDDNKGLGILQDIDPELAKNPAALITKIKEILKVRPRKDDKSNVPTRIPAPAILSRQTRSKSVSNLFNDEVSSQDVHVSQPEGKEILHSSNLDQFNNDNGLQLATEASALDYNVGDPERYDGADEVAALNNAWSVQSESGDSQGRNETSVPKLATPLTTGRSTLISRKYERPVRSASQDKENMSSSLSVLSGQALMSPTEDGAEFV